MSDYGGDDDGGLNEYAFNHDVPFGAICADEDGTDNTTPRWTTR